MSELYNLPSVEPETTLEIAIDVLRDAYNECEKAVNTLGESIKEITHIVEQAFEDEIIASSLK